MAQSGTIAIKSAANTKPLSSSPHEPKSLYAYATGKYWRPLPAVVIIVLLVSLVEALFILPAHLAHVSNKRGPIGAFIHRQQRFASAVQHGIERFFGPALRQSLRYRYVTLSVALAVLAVASAYAYSDHLGVTLMPQVGADEIEAGVRLPVGTTPAQAAEVACEVTCATQRMFD